MSDGQHGSCRRLSRLHCRTDEDRVIVAEAGGLEGHDRPVPGAAPQFADGERAVGGEGFHLIEPIIAVHIGLVGYMHQLPRLETQGQVGM